MAKIIYAKGNYLYIEDSDTGGLFKRSKTLVEAVQYNVNSSVFHIIDRSNPETGFSFEVTTKDDQAVNQQLVPFSTATLRDFFDNNTGNGYEEGYDHDSTTIEVAEVFDTPGENFPLVGIPGGGDILLKFFGTGGSIGEFTFEDGDIFTIEKAKPSARIVDLTVPNSAGGKIVILKRYDFKNLT